MIISFLKIKNEEKFLKKMILHKIKNDDVNKLT